ncbi:hypothetical protein ACH5RR_015479 [Cinchona calisaya]|uniref:Uncharacterized protein n=1 Tax=Cinchona calisaya TaxID=153742 RepID=A0ABD2ZWQ9_9GENT
MALYENKVPKQGNPLIHFGKNFSPQRKTSFPEKRRVLKIHEPSLRWNKMNQNGQKVVARTNGRHENLETLNFSRKGEVICKQCNKPKRIVANVDSKSPQLSRIVHSGEVKVLYQVRTIQSFMPQIQRNELPILRDCRTLLGPKENFYSKNIVNTMMVEVKSVEPLESGNQDEAKEAGEICPNKALGTNKNGTNANKTKEKGRKENKEGQDSSTSSSTGPVERNPAKRMGVMTS